MLELLGLTSSVAIIATALPIGFMLTALCAFASVLVSAKQVY